MSARRAALAALTLLAVVAIAGFKREENPSLPGVCVAWAARRVPVSVNASAYHGGCASPAAAADAIRAALVPWSTATRAGESEPCTDVDLTGAADTAATALGNDGLNLIVVRGSDCSAHADPRCQSPSGGDFGPCIEQYDCWPDQERGAGILALTTYTSKGNQLIDADVELRGWNGSPTSPSGFDFTCADPPATACAFGDYTSSDCISYDLRNTVTHEAGHVLGLDHSDVAGSTMWLSAGIGETDKRVLHEDDVDGICTIYPKGQDTSTCSVLAAAGCSSGEGAGVLALLAVGLAPWLRRRRR